jgi:putative transposase
VAQAAPQTVMLASDEAALYLQATTMAVWAARGQTPHIRVHAGREKVNFYGTLNLRSGQQHVTRTLRMNAAMTAQHLQALLDAYPEQPLLLLWDRAPWHRGQPIRDLLAANPRLELLALPVAAPDLNPQEQVWKATRRAVSHHHPHTCLSALAAAFEHHLTTTAFASSFLTRYAFDRLCPIFK